MAQNAELWKEIASRPGYYVSSLGRVKSDRCSLKLFNHSGGYRVIRPWVRGEGYVNEYVHRLVAVAFIPNPEGLLEVNHKNADKTDNRVENLEWCSRQHNIDHSVSLGLNCRGEKHGRAKLSESQISEIRNRYAAGGVTQKELGKIFGVGQSHIGRIVRGVKWAHTYEETK